MSSGMKGVTLLRGWSTMTPFKPLLIVTSLTEVFIEGMKYDDTFHTFSHCDLTVWRMNWKDGVRWHLSYLFWLWPHWKVSSYSIPSTNTSYSEVTMNKGVKGVIILHPLNKYCIQWWLLKGWSTMTPFIPFLIVTSLYDIFIEGMEYDDTFQTYSHCDLTVWNIYWWSHNDQRYGRYHRTPSSQ
jgi:hypothetical protein